MKNTFVFIAALLSSLLLTAPATAATRSVGQTLTYDVTTTNKSTSGPPAGLPPQGVAMYEAAMAKAAKGINSSFSIVVDRVDGNGTAHVNGSITSAEFPPAALAIAPYLNTFQAMLAPDGRIIPKYDPSLPSTTTRDNKYHEMLPTPESAQNLNANRLHVTEFNRFALGCGKRGALKPGDAWRVQVRDADSGATLIYDFAVTGTDTAAAIVTMKTNRQGQYGSQKIDATGHYDTAARLVTSFHEESTYDQTTPGGHRAGSDTFDFTLRQ
ncbi:MAG: hypothetical protein JO165_02070 [Candidatus Eremiobacteraeota bacterium]|nr:hypothetical protein [Candidatus Eremiobacteraeota bacterium]